MSDLIAEQRNNHYPILRKEIIDFLKCYDEINIYQFGFEIHYLPVYLAIKDLEIPVRYTSCKGNDIETARKVLSKDNDFLNGKIYIGLSEVYKCIHKCQSDCSHNALSEPEYNQLLQEPIIERVPLWGIARLNNPKINRKISELNKKDIFPYWKLFEGKFSLLGTDDFKDLRVSIYPEGSTIHRLFKENIIPKELKPGGDKEGLDLLFNNEIDICMTINPWYAISRSVAIQNRIEIVYNHLGSPHPFTCLYLKKLNDDKQDDIMRKFLKYFVLLVQYHIGSLYGANEKDIASWISYYCELIKAHAENHNNICQIADVVGHTKPVKDCNNDCFNSLKIATQILNDSRIYYHDTFWTETLRNELDYNHRLEKDIWLWEQEQLVDNFANERALSYEQLYEKYFLYHKKLYPGNCRKNISDALGIRDPIYSLSILMNKLSEFNHSDKILYKDNIAHFAQQSITDEFRMAFFQVGAICKYLEIPLNGEFNSKVKESMKIRQDQFEKIFGEKISIAGANYEDLHTFYMDKDFFYNLFIHFLDNLKDVDSISASYKYVKGNQILFLILEYIPKQAYDPANKHFVTNNPKGHLVLNGWHVKYTDGWEGIDKPLFTISSHGSLAYSDNKILYLENAQESYAKDPIELLILQDTNECKSKYFWIFSFRVEPDKRAGGQKKKIRSN